MKLLEKKDKDKRLISNWIAISLLNVDYKIISKTFAPRLKKVLPNLISSQQTAHVAQKFINESGGRISDLLSVTKKMKVKGYLVITDIEKAFDSLNYTFLISTLKNLDLEKVF